MYIIQCVTLTANNLRLSSQKIEIVGLLKDAISHSKDLPATISDMKKITVLSKLAIRINEIYSYLVSDKLDFLRVSEKFREHCQLILRDLNYLLDTTTVTEFKEVVSSLLHIKKNVVEEEQLSPIEVDLAAGEIKETEVSTTAEMTNEARLRQKELFILEDDAPKNEHDFFQNFEETILKPVKELDTFLGRLADGDAVEAELVYYSEIMKNHANLSRDFGATLVGDMHTAFHKGLERIISGELPMDKESAENLRACLIVIVALIKNKAVDIKPFLNRAEEFASELGIN